MQNLVAALKSHPVIAAVRTPEAVTRACQSPVAAVFLLGGSIFTLPGMVSAISAAIGARKININNMLNKSRKNMAVTVLELDKLPDQRLLTELMALPGVIRVRCFHEE